MADSYGRRCVPEPSTPPNDYNNPWDEYRPIYIACLTLFAVVQIGLALTPTSAYAMLVVLRFLSASGSAPMIALGDFPLPFFIQMNYYLTDSLIDADWNSKRFGDGG